MRGGNSELDLAAVLTVGSVGHGEGVGDTIGKCDGIGIHVVFGLGLFNLLNADTVFTGSTLLALNVAERHPAAAAVDRILQLVILNLEDRRYTVSSLKRLKCDEIAPCCLTGVPPLNMRVGNSELDLAAVLTVHTVGDDEGRGRAIRVRDGVQTVVGDFFYIHNGLDQLHVNFDVTRDGLGCIQLELVARISIEATEYVAGNVHDGKLQHRSQINGERLVCNYAVILIGNRVHHLRLNGGSGVNGGIRNDFVSFAVIDVGVDHVDSVCGNDGTRVGVRRQRGCVQSNAVCHNTVSLMALGSNTVRCHVQSAVLGDESTVNIDRFCNKIRRIGHNTCIDLTVLDYQLIAGNSIPLCRGRDVGVKNGDILRSGDAGDHAINYHLRLLDQNIVSIKA